MNPDAADPAERSPDPVDLDSLARVAVEEPPGKALLALDAARGPLAARRDEAGLERLIELAEAAKARAGIGTDDGLLGIRVVLDAEWDLRGLRRRATDPRPEPAPA